MALYVILTIIGSILVASILLAVYFYFYKRLSKKPSTPIFTSAHSQSYDIAISHFSAFSERAKLTFMYRFSEALSLKEAKKMVKYLNKIHNL